MASRTAILAVNIVSDGRRFTAGVNEVEGRLAGFQKKMSKLTVPATAVLAGLGAVGKKFVDLAADAEQMQGGMQAVFGKASADVDKFAATSADRLGLSGSAYDKLAAQIGTGLKGAGVPLDQLAGQTDGLMTKAADFASVFGGSTSEAADAFTSALKGNYEMLERYGVNVTASTITDRLKAKGMDKLTGAALAQAKQQETLAIINEQAAQYTGNFAKESNTLAGQQERLAAKFEDFGIKLGTTFLPLLTQLAQKFSGVVDWVSQNSTVVLILAGVLGGLAAAVLAANGAMAAWNAAQTIAKGATVAWTAAQWLFNAAMTANPIGIVIVAVVALIAAIVLAYNNIGWFKDGVDAAMKWIGEAWSNTTKWISDVWNNMVKFVTDAFKAHVAFIRDALNNINNFFTTIFNAIGNFVSGVVNNIANFFRAAFAVAQMIVSGVINAIINHFNYMSSLISGILNWIGNNFSSVFNWASNVVRSVINGIVGGFNSIVNAVSNVINWVSRLFNGFSIPGWLSKVMNFMGAGATGFTINGGVDMSGLTPGLGATGTIGLASIFGGSGSNRTEVTNVNITVNGAIDANSVAKQIKSILNSDATRNGRIQAGSSLF